jgi:chorismate lyase
LYALASSGDQCAEPRWVALRRAGPLGLHATTRRWLLDRGSLTQRLQTASNAGMRVRVLSQRWERPRLSERQALGIDDSALALVREVILECNGEPWVFARSILPALTLTGRLHHLRRFGSRSLGELLFSSRGISREDFEVARIGAGQRLAHALEPLPAPAWGRRSVFRLDGRALLVAEIFLPQCRLAI